MIFRCDSICRIWACLEVILSHQAISDVEMEDKDSCIEFDASTQEIFSVTLTQKDLRMPQNFTIISQMQCK